MEAAGGEEFQVQMSASESLTSIDSGVKQSSKEMIGLASYVKNVEIEFMLTT